MWRSLKHNQRGISLVDVMLAIAIFAIASVAIAYMLIGSLRTTSRTSSEERALAYTHEGIDAALSIRDWNFLDITDGTHGLTDTNGYWELTATPDSLDGGTYTRTIEITSLDRDSGTYDLSDIGTIAGRTHRIVVTVSWMENGVNREVSATHYVTDWSIREWTEKSDTDFTGGTLNDTEIVDTGDGAYIQLGTTSGGGGDGLNRWIPGGGNETTHDTNTDFDAGTFSTTQRVGTGTSAVVSLATQTADWRLYDSTADDESEIYGITVDEDSGEGWGVGFSGGIVHRKDGLWFSADSPTANTLWAVDSLAQDEAWAVGNSGTILHWTGNSWFAATSPTANGLFGMSLLSDTDGWAVGASGTVLRFNGANWQTFGGSLTAQSLNAVYAYSSTLAIAVGNGGVAYQFNGTTWSSMTTGTASALYGVHIVSPTEAWAVGAGGIIRKWNGTTWSGVTSPIAVNLRDITFVSPTDAWAVAGSSLGNTGIIHYNGTTWAASTTHTDRPLYSIDIDGTLAAIGGGTTSGADDGAVLELSGSTWLPVYHASSGTLINDVDFFGANFGIQVGNSGTIRHYNGKDWYTVATPTTQTLWWAEIVSTTDAWAVGQSGTILHWDGTSWSSVSSPTTQHLQAIDCLSATNCQAAASAGQLIRWNGTVWSNVVDTGSQNYRGIKLVSATDGWAMADSGRISRWNGTTWTQFVDLGNHQIRGVSCPASNNCWAAANSGRILHWNGTAWSEFLDTGNDQWYDVKMLSATDGWMVGNGGDVRRFNGTTWIAETIVTGDDLWGVAAISATDAWAAGENGTVIHFAPPYTSGTYLSPVIDAGSSVTWRVASWLEDVTSARGDLTIATRTGNTATPDGSWTAFSSELTNEMGSSITSSAGRYLQYRITFTSTNDRVTPTLDRITINYAHPTTQDQFAISLDAGSSGWGVGASGTASRYNGTKWTLASTPNASSWNGVKSLSASDAWAVGALGIIEHWNGTSWANAASPTVSTLNAVDLFSASAGKAVGLLGTILSYNGTSWSTSVSPSIATLNGVSMVSATEAWAVGATGTILHLSGGSWTAVSSGTLSTLYGVHAISASDVWAVGASGTILHYNGSTWSSVYSPVSVSLRSVDFASATDGWIVGDSGTLLRYNGYGWERFQSPTTLTLYAVDAVDEGNAWAVGASGTYIHWHGTGGGSTPATSGSYESAVFDSELTPATWETVSWISTIPGGTTFTLELRSGNVAVPDGTWSAYTAVTMSAGEAIPVPDSRYLQYRVSFTTASPPTSASLDEITVTYE